MANAAAKKAAVGTQKALSYGLGPCYYYYYYYFIVKDSHLSVPNDMINIIIWYVSFHWQHEKRRQPCTCRYCWALTSSMSSCVGGPLIPGTPVCCLRGYIGPCRPPKSARPQDPGGWVLVGFAGIDRRDSMGIRRDQSTLLLAPPSRAHRSSMDSVRHVRERYCDSYEPCIHPCGSRNQGSATTKTKATTTGRETAAEKVMIEGMNEWMNECYHVATSTMMIRASARLQYTPTPYIGIARSNLFRKELKSVIIRKKLKKNGMSQAIAQTHEESYKGK
jgi:hypothetical protein